MKTEIGRAIWNGLAAGPLHKLDSEDVSVELFDDGRGAILEGREVRLILRSPLSVFRRDRPVPALQPSKPSKRVRSRREAALWYADAREYSHSLEEYRENVRLAPIPDSVPISASVTILNKPKPTRAKAKQHEVITLGPDTLWPIREAFDKSVLLSDAQRRKHNFEVVAGSDGHSVEIKVGGLLYRLSSPHPRAFVRHDVFPEAWQPVPIDAPLRGVMVS